MDDGLIKIQFRSFAELRLYVGFASKLMFKVLSASIEIESFKIK